MTPERWKQIETLYHAAREHGAAVLAETDPDLRREVERLLAQDSNGQFLGRPLNDHLGDLTETQFPSPAEPQWNGRCISHYRILNKLGAGGMGVVYKAIDQKLGRLVALKFLPPHLSHDSELKARLNAEARAASVLDHPNVVVIYEVGETPEGDVFIAMAYHEGGMLREHMAAGLSIEEALQIARQIAAGLDRAHENGVLHRDIKPANVIIGRDGNARIIDFGLARTSDATISDDGAVRGTPLYMSPEQAAGKPLDCRTDLWSLGAVLYEMLAGRPPFPGDSQLQVMHAIVYDAPSKLSAVRPEVSPEVEAIVTRALQKDPAVRYQSAAEMTRDLSVALARIETPGERRSITWVTSVIAAVLVLAVMGGAWFYHRSEQRHWARDRAIPEIRRLGTEKGVAMFRLLTQAEKIMPGDPELSRLSQDLTQVSSIESTPAGAKVEIQDYDSPGDPWLTLGSTPLRTRRPKGYFRWRISKPGVGELITAPSLRDDPIRFDLAPKGTMAGMVQVPASTGIEFIGFIGLIQGKLPAFDIDKFEVTNEQYRQFVDQGGYGKREYWREIFVKDGKTLTWEQAMELFRDSTGRTGPSTWEGGHYPAGQSDYPVTGVSWYEAAAYAAFAGKSLPTIAQWYRAAPTELVSFTAGQSNTTGRMQKVGLAQGVGPYGTYDMVGNAWEWCLNQVDADKRFTMGGTRLTETNRSFAPEALPPFARTELLGIRCVANHEPLPPASAAPLVRITRDFSKLKPVSDAEFQNFQQMYAYDSKAPLDVQNRIPLSDAPDWTREKLTIDSGYDNERILLYVFLPKRVHTPYQAVLFYPSARVNNSPPSDDLGDFQFVDYVLRSGRALIYPIYTGTYQHWHPHRSGGALVGLEKSIENATEVRRAVDYMATRPDINASKIAYFGVSQGAAFGGIFGALDNRFRALIFADGGFLMGIPLPAADPVNFVARVKQPVLMVNGRYDPTFPSDLSQKPMFDMLGTPAADKRYRLTDTAHDGSQKGPVLAQEVLAWLDKYLGKVN